MNFLKLVKMPFSFHEGWDQLDTTHASVVRIFLQLVLPLSLLPPAMLLYAGSHHASAYMINVAPTRWEAVAAVFFIAELITVPLMGILLKQIASTYQIVTDSRRSFLLAAVTAIPMFLSSVGLAIPNMWGMISVIVLGLLLAASVLYHGTFYILKLEDPSGAEVLSAEAFASGALVWALLCAFVLLPLMN
ncbi:YIP1 family protein [Herbaspirillum sp. ST 5-3]|uniref:YIP1 family protein n=1 Tax=Oxalobacteraceae TaxID=75682 RepID=UPI0010A5968E|nr:YIP1 family protein [Herbaspirillum sp. ST 5-3]